MLVIINSADNEAVEMIEASEGETKALVVLDKLPSTQSGGNS